MTTRVRWLILLVSTPLVALVAVGGLIGATPSSTLSAGLDPMPSVAIGDGQQGFPHLKVFDDALSLIAMAYVEEVDIERVMDGAMRGLADGLDPSSAYLTPPEVSALLSDDPLPPADVGLVVTRQFYVRIVGVRDGSPADRAGLRPGDYIRMIDRLPTRDMSAHQGARLLRGTPGSTVTLLVIRTNAADPHEITLTREVAASEPVTGRLLDSGEAYVRIASFDDTTAAAVKARVEALAPSSERGVVVDVRGTADGTADQALAVARLFVRFGTLLSSQGRDGERTTVKAEDGDGVLAMPVELLVSNGTAHAAEIFAAALAGSNRAELVGTPTAGLAAEQRLVRLPGGHGLWMTHRRYLNADDEPIHGRGLVPDVVAANPVVDFGDPVPDADQPLARSLERAKTRFLLIK